MQGAGSAAASRVSASDSSGNTQLVAAAKRDASTWCEFDPYPPAVVDTAMSAHGSAQLTHTMDWHRVKLLAMMAR
jgi:hypothetical protein